MPLFDSALLTRLHRLWLVSRRGRHAAGGVRCPDRRDYSPGDDYRSIDWRYCARHDELLVPRFTPEPDDHVDLLLDCSYGMTLASKFAAARKAVAAAAYGALACSQEVGVLAYADRVVGRIGPVRGKLRAGTVLAFLERLAPDRASADLAAVASAFVRGRRRPGRAVVVSGTHDLADFQRGLEILRHHGYRPGVLRVCDPCEAEPALLGDVEISDVESGRSWRVTVTESDLSRYRQLYAEHCSSLERYCASRAIAYTQVAVDLPEDELLLKAVGAG